MPEKQPSTHCQFCRRAFNHRGHYKVASVLPDGSEKASVPLCSMICVIRWSYDFAGRQGAKGAMALRGQIHNPELWKKAIGGIIDHVTKGKTNR